MNTCGTCSHFHKQSHAGVRSDDFVTGTCHAMPPVRDFNWHRTRSHDYCAHHSANTPPQFATGTTGAAPLAALTAAAPSTDQAPRVLASSKSKGRPARGELFPAT